MMVNFEGVIVVETVHSQLERGCIFTGRTEDGMRVRVKFSGRDTQPSPLDTFWVTGLLGQYSNRFGVTVPQVSSKRIKLVVRPGALLTPWLAQLPNIGPTRAQRLITKYGHNLNSILGDVGRIVEVAKVIEPSKPALAARIAAQVYAAMAAKSGSEALKHSEVEFLVYLEKLGIRESRVASRLWRVLAGTDAIARLQQNPYIAASLTDWSVADRVGRRLLREAGIHAGDVADHPHRTLGGLSNAWQELLSRGDTAATRLTLTRLLEDRGVVAELALQSAKERRLIRYRGLLLRAPGAAWLEDQVATMLTSLETQPARSDVPHEEDLEDLIRRAQRLAGTTLTDEQQIVAAEVLGRPLAFLQGGAGVGKTTVMRVIAMAWELVGGNVLLAAIAGKAALTLSRGASSPGAPRMAYTVARLIGLLERQAKHALVVGHNIFRDEVSLTDKTLLILDEAGMIDTTSLHRLLRLLPKGIRVLLAGDDGQLPPVGFGRIFHDLVADSTRTSNLTTILRQAAGSTIPLFAASTRNGRCAELEDWSGQSEGIFLVPAMKLGATLDQLRESANLMVVAARRETVSGINELEAERRRPRGCNTRRLGPTATVAAGDPVVVTMNRYQDGLFNGLLGKVIAIDGPEVEILFDGELPRNLPAAAEADVQLAYAITCHKAQGSSAGVVVVVLEDSQLLTREWLYTAVTRGRELVILVGSKDLVAQAVSQRSTRVTGFAMP